MGLLFHSIPFYSIAFHSIPPHPILLHLILAWSSLRSGQVINQVLGTFQGTGMSLASLQTKSQSRHTSQSRAGLCGKVPWTIKAGGQGGCICLSTDLQFLPFLCCRSHSLSVACMLPILPSCFALSCLSVSLPTGCYAVHLPLQSHASLMTVSLSS